MMLPLLKNGDVVLINIDENANCGEIVCVLLKGKYLIRYLDEVTDEGITLRPANSLYPVARIKTEEVIKIFRISESSSRTKY